MRSYKVGIKTNGELSRDWVYNGLRFETFLEAHVYAHDIAGRWLAVAKRIIVETDDMPNYTIAKGELVKL